MHLRGKWAPVLEEVTEIDLASTATPRANCTALTFEPGRTRRPAARTTGPSATAWSTAYGPQTARPGGTEIVSYRRRTSPTRWTTRWQEWATSPVARATPMWWRTTAKSSVSKRANDDYRAVARLWRWTIDLNKRTVTEQQIDDRPGDFGRIDDRLIGLNARWGYLMAMGGEGNSEEPVYGSALWKYDLRDGTCWEQSARRRRARRRAGFRCGGSRFRRGRRLDHQPVARHGIGRVQAVDHRRSGFHGPANGHRPPAATRVVRRARQLGA